MLEERNDSNAAVDWVTETHVSFVGKGVDRVLSLVRVQLVEEFSDVAGTKHFVNICKLLGLVWWEVGCEYALRLALAPQKLACCAR